MAHFLRDKVLRAYARGELLVKCFELIDAWARYCTDVAAGAALDQSAAPAPPR